jgi:macrolide transport system ATP-binding/permease protein
MVERLKSLASRIRGAFTLRRLDRDFQQELRLHLDLLTEENIRRGMAPAEAARAARLRLGGVQQLRETHRELRGLPLLETFFGDLRYAFRALRRSPGFALVAILTLALGIGANGTIFSIVDSILLRPLPVRDPGQVVVLAFQQKHGHLVPYFSYPDFRDLERQSGGVFSGLLAYRAGLDGLSTTGQADHVLVNYVTGNTFSLLGLRPYLGRLILPGEGRALGADPVIVFSYDFWRSHFGADPSIVGREVSVNGQPVTVVGIAPKGFHGLMPFAETQAYLPISMSTLDSLYHPGDEESRSVRNLHVYGRLKSRVSLGHANSALAVISQRLSREHPKEDDGIEIASYPEPLSRPAPMKQNPIIGVAALFLALAALVLVLACVNVANILLVRAAARRREMALRAALGGTRARLTRQVLTESLVLALLGGAGGILLGYWAAVALDSIRLSADVPVLLNFGFDGRVFAYEFGAAIFTGFLVGIVPALRSSRANLSDVLREGGRGIPGGRQRLRSGLVVAQVAGSLMLLIVAGLFTRSLQQAKNIEMGFNPRHLLVLCMDPNEIGYRGAQGRQFYHQLLDRVRALPGVQSAALSFTIPMGGYAQSAARLRIDGFSPPPGRPDPVVYFNMVSPGYFSTLENPLLRGRQFTDADNRQPQRVAIINQSMAERYWPDQDPIGRKFSMKIDADHPIEVVGVARDAKYISISEPPTPYFFVPLAQNYSSFQTLEVRTPVAPAVMIPELRHEIRALAPGLPLWRVQTMLESLDGRAFLIFRFGALLAAAMGILGLFLALVGVYGVASYAVSQRTNEIGIRLALGAPPSQILGMIFRQGFLILGIGLVVGLAGALAAARIVGSYLVVSPTDPATYVSVSLLLASVTLLACYIPARRAMRVDPMVALRHE